MNTRQAIQPSNQPAVLSVSFSPSRTRFIVGLSEGCRVLRSDNCLTTYQPSLAGNHNDEPALLDGGVGVATVLDDRYLAYAGGGRSPHGKAEVFVFWDAFLGKKVCSFDLHERVLGIRLSRRYAAVVLADRTVLLEYQDLAETKPPTPPSSPLDASNTPVRGPNKVKTLYQTSPNPYALAVLRKTTLVLPAQSIGQVQLIPLPTGSKRVFRAHNTALRALSLSDDGTLLATASVQGTLIRLFDTATLDQVAEFRRGVDHAIITSLAISPGNRWIACTSDKGTLHVFDLRPDAVTGGSKPAPHDSSKQMPPPAHRKSTSHSGARIPTSNMTPSLNSTARSSSPASATYQGSVQEYYGLLPPPSSATPSSHSAAKSALNAFKSSSLAPSVFKDARSIASTAFSLGDEGPYWQGGAAYSWTIRPDGKRVRVKNPVTPLAADPGGRPPKGVVVFAPGKTDDDGRAVLYVVGGGREPRWELLELVQANNGAGGSGWALVNRGFRKYLTRQFVD